LDHIHKQRKLEIVALMFFQVSGKNTNEWTVIQKPFCLYTANKWEKWGTCFS